jgi:predicted transport protein
MENAMKLLEGITKEKGNNYILFRCDPRFAAKQYQAPMLSLENWYDPWKRVGRPDVYIDK